MLSRNSHTHWESARVIDPARRAEVVPTTGSGSGLLAAMCILLIGVYQRMISPLLGPTCRFHPTCSTYAIQAIHRYGPFGGSARALARLARCHPLNPGGYDPVQ